MGIKAKIIKPFGTTWSDYPDNKSLALLITFAGCDNVCIGCQNPDLKTSNHEKAVEIDLSKNYVEFISELEAYGKRHNSSNKIVLSGGDPLAKENIDFVKEVLPILKALTFDVCIYTGHDVEYVKSAGIKGFKFLKCGGYMGADPDMKQVSEKTESYIKFSSKNQKLYDSKFNLISNDTGIYYF